MISSSLNHLLCVYPAFCEKWYGIGFISGKFNQLKCKIMKIISRKAHGYLDYLVGILLIASPWLFNFYAGGAESWLPIILGAGTILYSLFTNYELGMIKLMDMRTHLVMDFAAGAFLALSPWIFGFADMVFVPHLVIGLGEILVAIMTNPKPVSQEDLLH
ncbi:SPW repeat domain-containing protein [Negadavirga shengliensis]